MTHPSKQMPLTDEQKAERDAIRVAANAIADTLSETEPEPRKMIWRTAKVLGVERAQALLTQTQEIEAGEGMLTADGSRRRTIGGVYLKLVRDAVSAKDRFFIFGYTKTQAVAQQEQAATKTPPAPATAAPTPFAWDDRLDMWREIGNEAGEGRTVKVTLVGRPGKAIDKGQFVMLSMPSMKRPDFPKGLPTPPEVETQYLVYIAAKQWKKVASVTTDADDVLIVEGFATYDPVIKGMAVFATNTSSKKLQAAMREQKSS